MAHAITRALASNPRHAADIRLERRPYYIDSFAALLPLPLHEEFGIV